MKTLVHFPIPNGSIDAPEPPGAIDPDGPESLGLEELFERGRAQVAAEQLEQALETYVRATAVAEAQGDEITTDRAWLNQCAVLIALQRVDEVTGSALHRMRTVLTAAADPLNCCMAAYNIAQVYELTKEHKKGLFYARIALDRARALQSTEWLILSFNQLGNLLLAESHLQQAREALEEALALFDAEEDPVRWSLVVGNLGYALALLGERRDGFRLLYESLREQRRLGRRRDQVFAHLDLCFAHLEVGRVRYALKHGMRSLALAEEFDEPISVQHALFLLGEAAQLLGDAETARGYFLRLQETYFPEDPGLPDLLLSVGIRQLVNLKA